MKRNSRLPLFRVVLAGAALAVLASCARPPVFEDMHGRAVSMGDFLGRWVLINYWAPWCAPCHEEIPELNRFAREYADEAVVLGVHLDGVTGERLRADAEKMGIAFPVLARDPGAHYGFSPPQVVPVTHILSPRGKKLGSLRGPQSFSDLRGAIAPTANAN